MKILNFLFLSALGRKIGYNLAQTMGINKVSADKRDSLINLTNMQNLLKKRIDLFNLNKRGHKREIDFDPVLLGCEWGFQRSIACERAQVLYKSNHLAIEGVIINAKNSH